MKRSRCMTRCGLHMEYRMQRKAARTLPTRRGLTPTMRRATNGRQRIRRHIKTCVIITARRRTMRQENNFRRITTTTSNRSSSSIKAANATTKSGRTGRRRRPMRVTSGSNKSSRREVAPLLLANSVERTTRTQATARRRAWSATMAICLASKD